MSEQENIALVQKAYDNFKIGNIQAMLDLLSPDVTWDVPEMENVHFSGKRQGRQAVGEFFAMLGASQETLQFEPAEFVAQGDKVVSLGHYEWRVKANGRTFGSRFAFVYTIRDGSITSFQEFTDTAVAVKAYQKAMSA